MQRLASLDECHDLLRRVSAGDGLWRHICLVAGAAAQLASLCRVDPAHCIAGAWLHDVGRAPGAAPLAAALTGLPPTRFAVMDHATLGECLLHALGDPFDRLASAVGRHSIGSVLGEAPPACPVEQVVFLADKFVGQTWLGFDKRMRDLVSRYGHKDDVHLCIPGAKAMLDVLAARACLSSAEIERLVRLAVGYP
jgi:HD superfamily phosphohydrolase YqeK